MSDHGHGERLSPIDASFLQLESAHAHMHVGWSAIYRPPAGAARVSIDQLRERIAERLTSVPRWRQRLLSSALGLDEPRWVDDPDFDIAHHVAELGDAGGPPMTAAQLAAARDALLSAPLDRARPLWHIALASQLSDGRIAIVGRVHHAMADGTAALMVAMLVHDAEDDEAPALSPVPWRPESAPNSFQRALDPLVHGAMSTSRAARRVAHACEHPRAMARGALANAGRVAEALSEDLLPHAAESGLNGPLGPRRTLVQHRVELAQLRAITRKNPATRNDAGLAVVAGALRSLALERGAPAQPLKALVPVNMRRAHERTELGNRVSMTSIWLPLELSSPYARLASVQRQTARFKRSARSQGTETVLSGIGLLPNPLRAPVLRAIAPGRFNLTISSVLGPRRALFMFGARLEEIYPVIPIVEQQTLSIGMLAYDGHLHFGLYADPDALSDVTQLPELIDDELRALHREQRPAVLIAAGEGGLA